MANSDNVVRAGLTPKFRDVETLLEMLAYDDGPADACKLPARRTAEGELLYAPPVWQFAVRRIELAANAKHTSPALDGPSIILSVEGAADAACALGEKKTIHAARGAAIFLAAGESIELSAGAQPMLAFRAYCAP